MTDPISGKSTFSAVKKDSINTGGVAFALIKETILIFGKERDLIVYDRLQKKELFSIPNVSFTGNWKEIRELHLPILDPTDFPEHLSYWNTYFELSLSKVFMTFDDERIFLVQIDWLHPDRPKYRKQTIDALDYSSFKDGFKLSLEYSKLPSEIHFDAKQDLKWVVLLPLHNSKTNESKVYRVEVPVKLLDTNDELFKY